MLAWKQLFIQRVRNSSLVERSRVIKTVAEAEDACGDARVVGEHSGRRRR